MGILRGAAGLSVIAVAVAVLAGCMPSPEPPRPATDEEVDEFQDQQAREWWESFAGDKPMPEVEVIEELPPDEAYPRQNECLQEAAIPGVTFDSNGGWTFDGDVSGSDPLSQAVQEQTWICNAQFPASGFEEYVLSQSELAWLHDFYVQRYRPCLASLGFDVFAFPSREQFVGDGVGYPTWVPQEYSVSPMPTRAQWKVIAERCPLPSLLDGWNLPANRPAA